MPIAAEQFDPLTAFYYWFINNQVNLALPHVDAVRDFGNIISTILYRAGQFQVELFTMPRPTTFTEHRHPNCDSIQQHLSGELYLTLNGQQLTSPMEMATWTRSDASFPPVRIGPGDWHSGEAKTPSTFLSFQRWKDGVRPTSVGLDWIGEPSSDEQKAMLDASRPALAPTDLTKAWHPAPVPTDLLKAPASVPIEHEPSYSEFRRWQAESVGEPKPEQLAAEVAE